MFKFSIIIPVYNVIQYLHECLDSVLCQTFKDYEVIIIDDGSTDGSGAVCDEYCDKDKRIKVYTLLRKTLDNYARSKKMMFCGDNENDFLEGLVEQSTPLLYLMTGHKVVIAKKHLFEKITNSNVEKIATEYIDDLDEAIIQLEPLFRNGKNTKCVKLFLVSYRDYLLTLLDYKLSVESDEDLRAAGDFYSFGKIYKTIEEAEKKLSNDKSIMNSLEDLIRLDKSFLEKFKKKGNQ